MILQLRASGQESDAAADPAKILNAGEVTSFSGTTWCNSCGVKSLHVLPGASPEDYEEEEEEEEQAIHAMHQGSMFKAKLELRKLVCLGRRHGGGA